MSRKTLASVPLPQSRPAADTKRDPRPPQLLVSVKSAYEASLALECGVDWIDLKQPEAGSLGAPTQETAAQVARLLGEFGNRSLALGEWMDLEQEKAVQLSRDFPIAKLGLSRCAHRPNFSDSFMRLADALPGTKLVPVLYADHTVCAAPNVEAVLGLARRSAAPFLLIDTFRKDGRRLGDWLSTDQLQRIIGEAGQDGIMTVLAGSLRKVDVASLIALAPAAIAVRGAVCDGQRTDSLCVQRMREWVHMLKLCAANLHCEPHIT